MITYLESYVECLIFDDIKSPDITNILIYKMLETRLIYQEAGLLRNFQVKIHASKHAGCTVDVWEWTNNIVPHFAIYNI